MPGCSQFITLRSDRSTGGCRLVRLLGFLMHRISGDMEDKTAVSAVVAELLPPLVKCVPAVKVPAAVHEIPPRRP